MKKVNLNEFHRHLIITTFKKDSAQYLEDEWYETEIDINKFFIAHEDFRRFPIKKQGNFAEFLKNIKYMIDQELFPFSQEIKDKISEYPPLIVVEREPDKFFVLDGQRRFITLWYQKAEKVKVFLYRGSLNI